jgi:molybdate transport system substrate-binding protein
MDEIARAFERESNTNVAVSYGATTQLAQQIEHGRAVRCLRGGRHGACRRFDREGGLRRDSRVVYARGQLALWIPDPKLAIHRLEDLTLPSVQFIAIAQPELAPYGKAAVEALEASGGWERVRPKIVYANSISMAKQYASSGNANVALTALSLVLKERGDVLNVDQRLYKPIDEAAAITSATRNEKAARRFVAFMTSESGRAVFAKSGYLLP